MKRFPIFSIFIILLFSACELELVANSDFWKQNQFMIHQYKQYDTTTFAALDSANAPKWKKECVEKIMDLHLKARNNPAEIHIRIFYMKNRKKAATKFWKEAPNSFVSCDIVEESYCIKDNIGFFYENRYCLIDMKNTELRIKGRLIKTLKQLIQDWKKEQGEKNIG